MKNVQLLTLALSLAFFGCKNDTNPETTKTTVVPEKTVKKPQTLRSTENIGQIMLVNSEEAERLMRSHNDLQIVDVRTEEELKDGKIDGAVNMIYEENFKEKMESLDKSKPVLVYCHSGRRSAACAKILQENGFVKIYDLKGGIKQWMKDGKPLIH